MCRTKKVPLGSVGWEEAGWIQTLVFFTQGAGCSLGLDEGVSCSSSPPHFTSLDSNPAEQTPSHSASAAQKAPLAVPHSAWCHQEGIDCSSEAGDMECPKPCWGSMLSPLPQDKGSPEAKGCWHWAVPVCALAQVAGLVTEHCILARQVSFRYHCQLYSEWRRTNQKVRLMIPASRSPHPVPHSLLSTKLMKKTADETTV